MQLDDVIPRYRRLRAICMHHQNEAMGCVADTAIIDHARRLGLAEGRNVLVDDDSPEMQLIVDLALHTARYGRTRAIERYARAARCAAGSEDARVLDALLNARFSIWKLERLHPVAGMIVTDLVLEKETWLMDEALTLSVPPGYSFAGRLCWPDEFAMTCLMMVPMDQELIEDVFEDAEGWLRGSNPHQLIEDVRFPVSIYRAAAASGILDNIIELNEETRAALAATDPASKQDDDD